MATTSKPKKATNIGSSNKSDLKKVKKIGFGFMKGKIKIKPGALDEDLNLIQAIPGFQDVPTFEMIITYFGSNSHKSTPWNKYMAQFNKELYFKN